MEENNVNKLIESALEAGNDTIRWSEIGECKKSIESIQGNEEKEEEKVER